MFSIIKLESGPCSQNPARLKPHVGSIPTSGKPSNVFENLRLCFRSIYIDFLPGQKIPCVFRWELSFSVGTGEFLNNFPQSTFYRFFLSSFLPILCCDGMLRKRYAFSVHISGTIGLPVSDLSKSEEIFFVVLNLSLFYNEM